MACLIDIICCSFSRWDSNWMDSIEPQVKEGKHERVVYVGARSRLHSCIISSISVGFNSNRIEIVCQSMFYRLEPYYIRWFLLELNRNSIPIQFLLLLLLPDCMPIVDSKRFDLLYIELTVNNDERSFNNNGYRCVRVAGLR